MNNFFPEIKKNFGFGCMRFPMLAENQVDTDQVSLMVDQFLEAGFNYFDTAHGYINGLSEKAVKTCLTSRHPREKYLLTDKLSNWNFKDNAEMRQVFETELQTCGVDYFDFLLIHTVYRDNYEHYRKCRAFETAQELKAQGKVHHVGFSFHDTPEMLEKVLTEHPEVEVVQLQFNYLDYDSTDVQSRKCYEVCVRHNKPVIVMEPVKGGRLVNLPANARKLLATLGASSPASYALRFAAGFPNIVMVLSGMSNLAQMADNLNCMGDFKPLQANEKDIIAQIAAILREQAAINCTACRYCVDRCPKHIQVPDIIACLNELRQLKPAQDKYKEIVSNSGVGASACLACGQCEKVCPQHLPVRQILAAAAEEFEK